MTVKEFIGNIQAYYNGNYTASQLKFIGAWVQKKNPAALPLIMAELFKQYSGRFKVLPGIAEFESAAKEVKQHRMHEIPKEPMMMLDDERDVPEEDAKELFEDIFKKLGEKKV